MTKPYTLNMRNLIAEFKTRYRLSLKTDHALLALVKTNIRAFDNSLDALLARVVGGLELQRVVARCLPDGGGEEVADALRGAEQACNEIARNIDICHRWAAESLDKVEADYRRAITQRSFILGMYSAILPLAVGVGLGKAIAVWWRS